MKKLVFCVILLTVLLASPVLAAMFQADLTVTEGTGTTYPVTGLTSPMNSDWMATNGYITATGRDTRVVLGSNTYAHMLRDSYINFAVPVNANSTVTYQMTTDNTAQDMSIVTGYNGYVTRAEIGTMQLGNQFAIETNAYIVDDSSSHTSAPLLPDADIAAGWTPSAGGTNWDLVNVDGDDANYVYTPAASSGHMDVYRLTNPAAFIGRITNVTIYAKCRSTAGGANSIKLGIATQYGASYTNTNYGANQAVTIGYATYSSSWATNPITGSDWDVGDLTELTYVLCNVTTVGGDSIRCTYCYIVVTYTGGLIVDKTGSISLYQDGNNNIVCDELRRFSSPTGFVDGGAVWNTEANAYDGNLATDATSVIAGTSWGDFLELTRASTNCVGVRIGSVYNPATISAIDLDAFYGGVWNHVYQGAHAGGWFYQFNAGLAIEQITSWRVRFYNTAGGVQTAHVYELEYIEQTKLSCAFTEGLHIINVTNNTVNTILSYNSVPVDTVGAATVVNTAVDWILMSNSVPYMVYYTHSVAGAPVVRYQPADLITGTVLPDRQGALENGTFVWGTNPAGVLVNVGALTLTNQATAQGVNINSPDYGDTVTEPSDMRQSDSELTMPNNEFYDFVSQIATLGQIDINMLWWWLASCLSIVAVATGRRVTNNVWVAGLLGAAASGIFVSMGGVELWIPAYIFIATVFVGVWQRTQEV